MHPQKIEAACAAWFARRTHRLDTPRALRMAVWLVPLLFGLISLALGQDDNWDLKNYHYYNAYALMNGRVGVDWAPAQWQSYFNPALDLLYYGLMTHLPAPLAGFVMGVLHGLNFVLLLAIARLLLERGLPLHRLPLLLALAGTLGAGFLAELGNSMGDNLIALFVLGALYLVLSHWPRMQDWDARALPVTLASGLVMGLGTGLKLTNAVYALALCLALLYLPGRFWQRIWRSFWFGIGTLVGLSASAGFWFLKMWQTFANPLFPQFNALFHSPLATEVGVIDTNYLPRGWTEALLWPFIFTHDFHRVSELVLKQTIWPLVYTLFIMLALKLMQERWARRHAARALDRRVAFVLIFFGIAYLEWLKLFGIYRYLIPLELLAPLVVWLLLQRLMPTALAHKVAAWLLVLVAAAVFPFVTWGHTSWSGTGLRAELPPLDHPEASVVFIAHGHPPMGWLATQLPPQAMYMSVGAGFPESPAFVDHVQAALAARAGPHFVMVYANTNHEEVTLKKKQALADWLGLTASDAGCARLDAMMKRVRFHVDVQRTVLDAAGPRCNLALQPQYQLDLAQQDRATLTGVEQTLGRYGLTVLPGSCRRYQAAIGTEPYPYQFCQVVRPAI